MSRQISRAEAWERAHQVFTQVNFNAFDYNTIKESLLDYLKLYYPEDFNDYIESSEFIALLEIFAYIGELVAYRLDLNAHENFITTAQRKESILRLAKLISYKASRNIPARGLVKITSVQTTESVYDSSSRNLGGRKIIWNDNNNINWKEQFILVLNRILEQEFGTVTPSERVQVDDVLFELYTLNNNPLSANGKSVFPFTANITGQVFPMELVPSQLSSTGPSEKRPEVNGKFSLLYLSDGLGDASDTTGFMVFAKQGTLQRQQTNFDGITPNQTYDITINDINETDVWVNNVDPDSREILINDPNQNILTHSPENSLRYGEWVEVDLSNSQNILFNTNPNRRKYEIETLDNDQARLIFGDGEFADVPSGSFDIWFRTSANQEISIPRSSVVNQTATFTYSDTLGNIQTFTFTFSLVSSLLNASPSEDTEHIRQVAPAVYYTQDRMVNGRDLNSYPLQDPTILKLRTINRTFAGDSKYIAWHDPSESYENVKVFGDDLALYWIEKAPDDGGLVAIDSPISATDLIATYVEPLLCSTDLYTVIANTFSQPDFTQPIIIRCEFTTTPYEFNPSENEVSSITTATSGAELGSPSLVDLYYSAVYDEWTVGAHPWDIVSPDPRGLAQSIWMIRIRPVFSGSDLDGWTVEWRQRKQIAHSVSTDFWNVNTSGRVIDFDTLASLNDYIAILKANINSSGLGILENNVKLTITGQELIEVATLENAGLPDKQRISVITEDVNGDSIPDNITLPELFNKVTTNIPVAATITLASGYNVVVGDGTVDPDDLRIYGIDINGDVVRKLIYGSSYDWVGTPLAGQPSLMHVVTIQDTAGLAGEGIVSLRIDYVDYAYLKRESNQDPWVPVEATDEIKSAWVADRLEDPDQQHYVRYPGRYPFNFAWYHFTPRLNLVDPAPSNINDMFVVTRGYYLDLKRWIENRIDNEPAKPTPQELRNTYSSLLDNKMISDTIILHPGTFKILFGSKAIPQLQASLKIIRPANGGNLTDNEVKVRIVNTVRNYFDVTDWEFGETFYFSELSAVIHSSLGSEIDAIVLVPKFSTTQFGDLYQIAAREDELFIPDISTADIDVVLSYTATNIRQTPSS